MDIFEEDFLELIKSLEKNSVKYIFVGGLATNLNGFSRTTGDIDIWLKDETDNRRQLRRALFDLGLGDLPMIETSQFIPGWSALTMNNGIELDIMTSLVGLEQYDFDYCYNVSPVAEIYGMQVKFLHINLLIENKRKVNRAKDQIDVMQLEEIKKEKGL